MVYHAAPWGYGHPQGPRPTGARANIGGPYIEMLWVDVIEDGFCLFGLYRSFGRNISK